MIQDFMEAATSLAALSLINAGVTMVLTFGFLYTRDKLHEKKMRDKK